MRKWHILLLLALGLHLTFTAPPLRHRAGRSFCASSAGGGGSVNSAGVNLAPRYGLNTIEKPLKSH